MSTKKRHSTGTQKPKGESPPRKKDKRFPIRMRSWVFDAGQKAAEIQNRSLSSLMETLLILHLREQDLIPEDVDIELRQLELRRESLLVSRLRSPRRETR